MTRLVVGNLFRHPVRTLLTVFALAIAIFLLCFLQTVLTTLEAGVESASTRRLWVSISPFPTRTGSRPCPR